MSGFHPKNNSDENITKVVIENQNHLIDLQQRDMRCLKDEIKSLKRQVNFSKIKKQNDK